MARRKKYVLVGPGGRARMFYTALATTFKNTAELCAFCDVNQTRMDYANSVLKNEFKHKPVRTYKSEDFDKMIKKEKPDTVIVCSVDRTHHRYTIRAMELGCDVISEKPMTVDETKCQAILDAIKSTGKKLRVTFNYRYAPISSRICELLRDGVVGRITCAHFEWLLDTNHGADYFRRWHRDKRNSGGLMVHKSTHHFDLVNWWLNSAPKTVFGMGDLKFYGRENAEERGVTKFYDYGTTHQNAKGDPFALDLKQFDETRGLYLDAHREDGYHRDQSVFGDCISIEDTMGVMVRYQNNAVLTYSLFAYSPYEGWRISINGTAGRLEAFVNESSYINAGGASEKDGVHEDSGIRVFPMHGKMYRPEIKIAKGGHGGGDPVMLNDIFGNPGKDPLKRAASHVDGARSILTGIAANKSFATGLPINVETLVKF